MTVINRRNFIASGITALSVESCSTDDKFNQRVSVYNQLGPESGIVKNVLVKLEDAERLLSQSGVTLSFPLESQFARHKALIAEMHKIQVRDQSEIHKKPELKKILNSIDSKTANQIFADIVSISAQTTPIILVVNELKKQNTIGQADIAEILGFKSIQLNTLPYDDENEKNERRNRYNSLLESFKAVLNAKTNHSIAELKKYTSELFKQLENLGYYKL